jgi:cytochrome P450
MAVTELAPARTSARQWPPRVDLIGLFAGIARKGDIASRSIGPFRWFVVSDPDAINEVLVVRNKAFVRGNVVNAFMRLYMGDGLLGKTGEDHLRRRRMVQPAFHRAVVERYVPELAATAEEHAEQRWTDGQQVDVHTEMLRLTLAAVSRTLLGSDVEMDRFARAHAEANAIFDTLMKLPAPRLLPHLPLPSVRALRGAQAWLQGVAQRIIDARRDGVTKGDDLLQLLLELDEDGGPLPDSQIRDEVLTALLTGHDTIANGLTWTWYLLSEHPEAAERLAAEADEVLGGRAPRLEDLGRLTYTRQVLSESMRLYPPVWAITRYATSDQRIGGQRIPQGSVVATVPYLVHRDARWWPEPTRFDPGRWTPQRQREQRRFAYFPFGAGVHRCIGEGFAWTEGVLVLATLARRWRFCLRPGHVPQLDPRITLQPRHGMPMTLARR